MEKLVGVSLQTLIKPLQDICTECSQLGEVPIAAACIDCASKHIEFAGNCVERDKNPVAHAECLCLEKMSVVKQSRYLTDIVLVSTLEPCTMCMGALANARVSGLVYFIPDEKAGYFTTQSIMISRNHPTAVRVGIHSFWAAHVPEYTKEFLHILTSFFESLR